MDRAEAWRVMGADGHKALFKDRATAERYAVRVHGVVDALFLGRRRSDDRRTEAERQQAGEAE